MKDPKLCERANCDRSLEGWDNGEGLCWRCWDSCWAFESGIVRGIRNVARKLGVPRSPSCPDPGLWFRQARAALLSSGALPTSPVAPPRVWPKSIGTKTAERWNEFVKLAEAGGNMVFADPPTYVVAFSITDDPLHKKLDRIIELLEG